MNDFLSGVAFGVLYARLVDSLNPAYRPRTLKWARSTSTEYGSFLWMCDEIGLEPDIARKKFMRKDIESLKAIIKELNDIIKEDQ